jgi:hypothetical protein
MGKYSLTDMFVQHGARRQNVDAVIRQDRPPHGVVADGGVVPHRGNPSGSAVDASLDAAASPTWAEPAAGGVLYDWRRRYLPSSPAAITAQ